MTAILTWNIQYGLGCDGVSDVARIAATISGRDPDVICLQEVAQNVPDLAGGDDQVEQLAGIFAGYELVFGAAIDRAGGSHGRRLRFGNAILSRLPLVQIFTHPLPQPAAAGVKHMPRQATEVVVETAAAHLRIITTHLEFHSEPQRLAQAERLRALQREAEANAVTPGVDGGGLYALAPRPASAVFCGDFNATPNDPVHALLTAPLPSGNALKDAWTVLHPGKPHPPTTGIFDRKQWPQGAHCRDYFFVTADVAEHIAEVEVDLKTDQSDHQSLILRLR